MPDLLIELFSEEIPARMQARAAEDLKKKVTDGLVEAGLTYAHARAYSTPRRLTLALEGLLAESPTVNEERKGPKVGAPDKAIEGFLRGAGVAREDLEERETPKGAVYFATITKPGRPAAEIVAEVLEDTIRNFPWPKSMRWGAGSLRWVRPLHSILCILSAEDGHSIVPLDIDGITSGDTTEGHRFMGEGRFAVTSFEDYEVKLKRSKVVLNAEERAETIWNDATNMAFAQGLEVVEDKGLLAEVAGLVEWPVVLMGDIAEDFLGLPPEVLQTSMKEHQKFFSVKNPKTGRIEKFVTVANRATKDDGATILAGNQKVLFARLSDAKFFWENDVRTVQDQGFEPWVEKLDNVTFHAQIGSQGARVMRIAHLASVLAPSVNADPMLAQMAAQACKADLSSEMVYEFPELQGLMGRYYAQAAELPVEVGQASEEHYSPLGPSDDVPSAPVSVAVAMADKLDTLSGFWAIDEKPTGSKDPYALRRAALGVIRLVLENGLRINLLETTATAVAALLKVDEWDAAAQDAEGDDAKHMAMQAAQARGIVEAAPGDLLSFFHDRLKVYLRDQGIRHDVIDACIAMPGNDDLALLVARARALQDFMSTEDGENLLQGFKRANNILSQAEEKDGVEYSYGADVKFAEDDSEKTLFAVLDQAEGAISSAIEAEDFASAMGTMASLRAPIDAFFEAVQVNSDNDVVRRNRLNLLSRIRTICLQAADLTRVEG
ncbi:glycine--tRNA ligase subunit beta [Shimia marina]|uniref:Glycine--tRNA ligase beta subunit n=1 Tax=Shimia marina TaxID=321267 RepID=A0A0N7LS38_9RHOB|nr:glycine--tRNA ligase subunit beta [Shimia marina]CUH52540.1 Glycine--tRNA ligase beta subunit [Shimia marina]SFE49413.1 glycyl-tRNA synthetase beta chain [Shimia marina]